MEHVSILTKIHFHYGELWRGVGYRRHIRVTSGDRLLIAENSIGHPLCKPFFHAPWQTTPGIMSLGY